MEHAYSFVGTPLIPIRFILIAGFGIIGYLFLILISVHARHKKSGLKDDFKSLFRAGLLSLIILFIGALLLSGYWFLPSPRVSSVTANTGSIEIVFDRPVGRRLMEKNIYPDTPGVWIFEEPMYGTHLYRKVVFYSDERFTPNTEYKISLQNIQNTIQRSKAYKYEYVFNTKDIGLVIASGQVTKPLSKKLSVPVYLQQHTLSCELASLRMALAFRDIKVSEEELLAKVGVDTTSHEGDIWGNPYEKFVGNVDGRQMRDGYGVYWGPIERVAKEYRDAASFEGWSIQNLTKELEAGNPVMIWVYAGSGITTFWYTPQGQKIYAVRDEHAVLAVGFVGEANDPSKIIVNDPLIGNVYWTRGIFDKKWNIFGNSGVVIY